MSVVRYMPKIRSLIEKDSEHTTPLQSLSYLKGLFPLLREVQLAAVDTVAQLILAQASSSPGVVLTSLAIPLSVAESSHMILASGRTLQHLKVLMSLMA
jgi:hypothetical protein